MTDPKPRPESLSYELMRTLFAIRSGDSQFTKFIRPAFMSITGSILELPYSMVLLNIKNNIITGGKPFVPTFQEIINARGFFGLYYGTLPEVVRQTSRQFIRGPGVVIIPQFYRDNLPPEYMKVVPLSAGVTLAVIETTATTPIDAYKTYRTTFGISKKAIQPFNPFVGYGSTLARQTLAWPLLFVSSAYIQKQIERFNNCEMTFKQLACVAPLNSASCILPPHIFDVVKTRQQAATAGPIAKMSIMEAFIYIVKHEGFTSLTRGSMTSVVQRVPAVYMITGMPLFYARIQKDNSPLQPFGEIYRKLKKRFSQDSREI